VYAPLIPVKILQRPILRISVDAKKEKKCINEFIILNRKKKIITLE
jgi:hypothetical protein